MHVLEAVTACNGGCHRGHRPQIEEPFSVAIPIPSHDRDMTMTAQIEEPFSILPLIKCHKWLLTDVRRTQSLVRNLSNEPAAATTASPEATK